MENRIVKIGSVEMYENDLPELYESGRIYFVTYSKIYQLMWANNYGWYGQLVYTKPTKGGMGFTRRGRFYVQTAKQVNKWLGFKLFIEEEV